jgi:hemerythrin-like domain-containing protein
MSPTVVRQSRSILEEHRKLRHSVNRIQSMVSNPPDPAHRPAWLRDVSGLLVDLTPRLIVHFESEEKGGLFEEIQQAWPTTAEMCRTLLGEHRILLARLSELSAASGRPMDEAAFGAFLDRASSLLKDLSRHEERENDLLYRTLEGGPSALD